jgi:DNA-directed RNA polymerase specialized sigma24 family protein
MDQREAEDGRARGARGPARDKLPVVAVDDAREMAVMLARHNRLLREYARHYLPKAADDVIEEAVEQTVEWLLAIEDPSLSHGLRYATHALWRECQRTLQRLERQKAPVDRKLGPLTGRVGRVLERLGPRQRRTILLAAQGLTPAQIAAVDNSTAASVRVRLYRARERAIALLQENGPSMPAVLLLMPHRVRGFVGRHVAAFGEGFSAQALATSTLVPLIACTLFSTAAPALAPQTPAPVAFEPVRGGVLPASTSAVPSPPAVAAGPIAVTAHAAAPVAAVAATTPAATPRTAAEETPEDVLLILVGTPPSGRAIIVGTGMGVGCQCSVLMRSVDGGATWSATDGPPADATQLVLPPDYPSDPRIFFGVDPQVGVAPYVTAGFGLPYEHVVGLPPGEIAVSAHFDDGDPRLFSAGATAVWSVRMTDAPPLKPHDEVDYSAWTATTRIPAAVGTPAPTPGGPAVLVWAPSIATVPDAPTVAPTSASRFLSCPAGGACIDVGNVPAPPAVFSRVLAGRNGTVLAFTVQTAYLSHDGGHSFTELGYPQGALAQSVTLAGPDWTPWLAWWAGDGRHGIGRLGPAGWVDMSANLAPLKSSAVGLFPLGQDRIIASLHPQGYRCTASAGGAWASRCPAAAT